MDEAADAVELLQGRPSWLSDVVAAVASWRGRLLQTHPYVVGGAAAVTVLVGVITALYVWVASRQVRPRKVREPPLRMPTSPTSKRLRRRSKSFTGMLQLERERRAENERLEQEDHVAFPRELRQKFTPEQLKIIYDTLAKVGCCCSGVAFVQLSLTCFGNRCSRSCKVSSWSHWCGSCRFRR